MSASLPRARASSIWEFLGNGSPDENLDPDRDAQVLHDFCFPQAPTAMCRQTGRFLAPGPGFDMPLPPDAARGRDIFLGRPMTIGNVHGAGVDGSSFVINQVGTCATCHDGRDVGTNVAGHLMDIGVAARESQDLTRPVYVFTNKVTGEKRHTTDPGRALNTGRWADMDCFKVPRLRELSKRAPYSTTARPLLSTRSSITTKAASG